MTYQAGLPVTYTIVASNPAGPGNAAGAVVIATFSPNLTNITWTCRAFVPAASCTPKGSGNIKDTVDLPVMTFVVYTVNATVIPSPGGDLVSTATINPPAGISDPDTSNNTDTDIDLLALAGLLAYGNIDPPRKISVEGISEHGAFSWQLDTPLVTR